MAPMGMFSVAGQKILERSEQAPTESLRKSLRKEARHQMNNDVFGAGHKTDRHGKPIEQGIGSPGNGSMNDAESYKKYHTAPLGSGFDEEVYQAKIKNAQETRAARAKQAQDDDDE